MNIINFVCSCLAATTVSWRTKKESLKWNQCLVDKWKFEEKCYIHHWHIPSFCSASLHTFSPFIEILKNTRHLPMMPGTPLCVLLRVRSKVTYRDIESRKHSKSIIQLTKNVPLMDGVVNTQPPKTSHSSPHAGVHVRFFSFLNSYVIQSVIRTVFRTINKYQWFLLCSLYPYS